MKVSNKATNKRLRAAGVKEAESRGRNVQEQKAEKAAQKTEKQAARRSGGTGGVGDGQTAESRKKAKRSHGAKHTGVPSVKQQKQHSHEPHAMARHDAAYNQRAQEKAARRAGKLTPQEESAKLAAEAEADPEANAADERFFAKHQNMAGFLDNLNAEDLNWTKEDRKKPKLKFPQPAPGQKKKAADSDEDLSDDDDDEEDDEDEDDSEDEDDAPATKKAKPAKRYVHSQQCSSPHPSVVPLMLPSSDHLVLALSCLSLVASLRTSAAPASPLGRRTPSVRRTACRCATPTAVGA